MALYHFHRSTGSRLAYELPGVLQALGDHLWLGVEIFFVLSGFVIAYSVRGYRITPRFVGNFALRRSIRLDPPYWTTIALAIALLYVSSRFGNLGPVRYPEPARLVAHLFYVQDLLGLRNIVYVFWTLCLEVQFYLVLVVGLGLLQWLSRLVGRAVLLRGACGSLLYVTSLLVGFRVLPCPQGLFLTHWYMFFLGALIWWTIEGSIGKRVLWLAIGALAGMLVWRGLRPAPIGALVTVLLIYGAHRAGRLTSGLGWRPVQFLGRISYSLYLVHPLVGIRVRGILQRLFGPELSPVEHTTFLILATAASVGVALILNVLVERPSVRLAQRFKRPPRREREGTRERGAELRAAS